MKKKTEQEIKQEMEDFSSAVQRFREAQRNALYGADNGINQAGEAGEQSASEAWDQSEDDERIKERE